MYSMRAMIRKMHYGDGSLSAQRLIGLISGKIFVESRRAMASVIPHPVHKSLHQLPSTYIMEVDRVGNLEPEDIV